MNDVRSRGARCFPRRCGRRRFVGVLRGTLTQRCNASTEMRHGLALSKQIFSPHSSPKHDAQRDRGHWVRCPCWCPHYGNSGLDVSQFDRIDAGSRAGPCVAFGRLRTHSPARSRARICRHMNFTTTLPPRAKPQRDKYRGRIAQDKASTERMMGMLVSRDCRPAKRLFRNSVTSLHLPHCSETLKIRERKSKSIALCEVGGTRDAQ